MKDDTKYLKKHGLCNNPANRRRARIATGEASHDDYVFERNRLRGIYRACTNKETEYARAVMAKIVKYDKELENL